MKTRRSHYEMAFEAYLNRRGTPYVAVEDVRHFVKGKLGAKAFDYIVYPAGGSPCLVDVKGRKIPVKTGSAETRTINWVTRADIEGFQAWKEVFGAEYHAMFAFAYWLAGGAEGASQETGGQRHASLTFAGRRYSFWLVNLTDYASHQRQRSKRWDTVNIPVDVFRRITRPLDQAAGRAMLTDAGYGSV